MLANWFDDPSRLDSVRTLMKDELGVDWEPVSTDALRKRLKTQRYYGGLFEPNAFHFHPLKYVLGVAAARGGARVYERSAALGIAREGAGTSCARRRARCARRTSCSPVAATRAACRRASSARCCRSRPT